MTNIQKFIGIFAIAAFTIFATSCKKGFEPVTEYATFEFTGSTDLYFTYSQTLEIPYTMSHIARIEVEAEPLYGWSCTYTGTKFIITTPAETIEKSGNIIVRAHAEEGYGSYITKVIRVEIVDVKSELTPANSFIVSEPAARYRFKALKGGIEGQTLSGATAATRLWTTSAENAIHHISFEDGYIYFSTGGTKAQNATDSRPATPAVFIEGNTLIAATDDDGNILWSWHIWSVADDPENPADGPTDSPDMFGGTEVMNRNLGAFAAAADSTPEDVAWRSYGLFYQWGRKDPFVGPDAWNTTTQQPLYNPAGEHFAHTFAVSDAKTGTPEYAAANPSCFIAGSEGSDYDWLFAARNNGLWTNTSPKTIHDPCPAGWRVAAPEIFAGFIAGTPEDYVYGWNFATDGGTSFFPAAGRRSFSPSLASAARNYTNIVNDEQRPDVNHPEGYPIGFYWSGTAPSQATRVVPEGPEAAVSLSFGYDHVGATHYVDAASPAFRANGFPVRCMKEA